MLYDCPIWEAHIIHTTYKIYLNWLFILSVRFLISSRLLVKFGRSPNFYVGFPDGSAGKAGKESACNAGDTGEVGSIPGSEDPLEKEMATYSSILARKIPWGEAWWATVQRVAKSWTQLSN